jgi:2-C-methyl-D-erythritol 4-phosphate cytidylyltransferase
MPPSVINAIIVASGRSERMAGEDKLWAPLVGPDGRARPALAYSIAAFEAAPSVERVAVVVQEAAVERTRALAHEHVFDKVAFVVPGGPRRRDSVRAGLEALNACDYVAVHDGARPLVTHELIEACIEAARPTGASVSALPVRDTVKESEGGVIIRTLDRSRLYLAQTPQVVRYDLLVRAHQETTHDATDDAALLEEIGVSIRLVEGASRNLKVTTPDDLALVRSLLTMEPQ